MSKGKPILTVKQMEDGVFKIIVHEPKEANNCAKWLIEQGKDLKKAVYVAWQKTKWSV